MDFYFYNIRKQFSTWSSAVMCLAVFSTCRQVTDTLFTRLDPDETGIDFANTNHETELSNILTYEYFYNGGGVAIGDINNDNLPDIYFTSNIFKNKLYLNLGNLKFKDITEESGAACEVGWKTGVTMADVNADGFLDIYVCRSASPNPDRRRNILLINNGNLTFTERAKEYNLDDSSYSTQAAFFDFDNDGDLDMVLLNHSLLDISNSFNISLKNSTVRFPEVGNKLYRNDSGKFVDVSDEMGVFGSAFNYGLGLSLSDINNDGWTDMYLGCDYTGRDKMLLNEQGKYFRDVTHEQLTHISKFTMGTDIADVNGDGWMDILTLDMLPEDNYRQKQLMGTDAFDVHATMVRNGLHAQYMRNMLHLNNGNGTFSEIGQLAGISNTDWSWGGLIQDYNNDGIPDIFISNGFKRDLTNNDFAKYQAAQNINAAKKAGQKIDLLEVVEKFKENKLANYAFQGNGDATFSDVTRQWGFEEPLISNGIAYSDLDNDGDLDLVANNMNAKAGIYRNNTNTGNARSSFVAIQLKGKKNTFGVGAKVVVFAGARQFAREQLPVRGFQSTVDNTLHIGLGTVEGIDSVHVHWPGGGRSTHTSLSINSRNTIGESGGSYSKPIKTETLSVRCDTLLNNLRENGFVDFNTQPLLPRMYSTQGPAMAVADVNADGLNDIYVGAPKGTASRLLIQKKSGQYEVRELGIFNEYRESEETDAAFFDMDADGDLDLYTVTGGYEFDAKAAALQDILYENDGHGNFKSRALPKMLQSGSCVRAADVDQDKDLDLFVGGRISPGRYPETPASYLLKNDGKGNFAIDSVYGRPLMALGMVTDAEWIDLNGDSLPDLVAVGEWMAVKVFVNSATGLVDRSTHFIKQRTEGLWNDITAADFDRDGDKDFVVGNMGLNTQLRVSGEHPLRLYYADFDGNGSIDPILDTFIKDQNYPYPTRDELFQQIPSFKKRFPDYHTYSLATTAEVLTPDELKAARKLEVHELQSCYFRNNESYFEIAPLPLSFQVAPIFSSAADDFDDDGDLDIISTGNISATRARTGKLVGNYGLMALGNGRGVFTPYPSQHSGLSIKGDVRHVVKDNNSLIVAINDCCILKIPSSLHR